jgi:hypothetical protein
MYFLGCAGAGYCCLPEKLHIPASAKLFLFLVPTKKKGGCFFATL